MNNFITLKYRIESLDKKYKKCIQLLLLINFILFGLILLTNTIKETNEQITVYIITLLIYIIINFIITIKLHLLSFDLSKYRVNYRNIEYYIKKEKSIYD